MGGANPYIKAPDVRMPTKPYTITFILGDSGERKVIQVDPAKFPYDHNGLPGSVLDIGMGNGLAIDHACGGVCACSTCHVLVREGMETCNEANDDELDQLDNAPNLTAHSRLSCQCVPNGTRNIIVEIPAWNRNLVQEGH